VSECDREASIMRRPWTTRGLLRHWKTKRPRHEGVNYVKPGVKQTQPYVQFARTNISFDSVSFYSFVTHLIQKFAKLLVDIP
jgi:hypothetical protein